MKQDEVQVKAEELMKQVSKKGFNIYQCLNRVKKEARIPKRIPPEVIVKVCQTWLKDPKENSYPWFVKAFVMASSAHFADSNIKEHAKQKKQPVSMKEIMRRIYNE